MKIAARWSLALTAAFAVLAATLFAASYSGMEMNDVRYKGFAHVLPIPTQYFAQAAPWAPAVAVVVMLIAGVAAARRADLAIIVVASVAWLFAFSWVLLCLLVWRTPFILIGGVVH